MKTAFVTGGTGFIGSHLVEELLRRDYEVRCLVRTDRRWLRELPIREFRGDLFDERLVSDAVRGADLVFHNAGVTRARDWNAFQLSNVEATTRLLDVVARDNPELQRVVITSSLAAVGPCPGGVATETSELNPISRYGKSKALMEREVAGYMDRLPITIIRPPSVYGPREADIYTFFKTMNAGICPIIGDPDEPALSLVHVRDLVRGMVDAAEVPATSGETYFLGSETFYSWNDIKHAAAAAIGRKAITVRVPSGLVETVGAVVEALGALTRTYPPLNREKAREIRYVCKMCRVDKARRDFGYEQRVKLSEGMRETIAWYRAEGWL